MFGWNILFMNPIKKERTKMKTKGIYKVTWNWRHKCKFLPSHFFWAPTYWRRLERIFVGKIYSHLPHASFVRCWMWEGSRLVDYWDHVVFWSNISDRRSYIDHRPPTPPLPDRQPNQSKQQTQHHNAVPIILRSNLLQHWRIPYFQAASSNMATSKR